MSTDYKDKSNSNGKKGRRQRSLPSNVDAERFVLGSIQISAVDFVTVRHGLEIGDFSLETHQTIFRRMGDLSARGEKIDRITVASELTDRGELDSVGGFGYLVSLDDGLPQAPNVDAYIRIIKKKSKQRRLAHIGNAMSNHALLETDDPDTLAARMRQDLDAMQVQDGEVSAEEDADALEFPEIAWRGIFGDYRAAMLGTTEGSDVAHFCTIWATVAAILGRNVWMYAGDLVYPNVYINYFGPTGDKKTTCERRISACGLLEHSPDVRLIQAVASAEGLGRRMEGSRASLFFWEEFSQFLGQAKWDGSTLLEFVTQCFDCPPVFDKPNIKNPVHVVNPTPTILTASTPEWFWKRATPEDFLGGFGNRFAFFTGQKKPALPRPNIWDDDDIRRIKDRLKEIAAKERCCADFTAGARKTWDAFYIQFEDAKRSSLLRASTKRAHVYVRKLAMTYAALEGTLPQVTKEQLYAAIAVINYSVACTEALLDLRVGQMSRDTTVSELGDRILKHIEKYPGRRKRDVQQVLSKYGDAERFNRSLKSLEQADRIEVKDKRLFLSI
ncbi:MAG: DnaB-like helicase N-terminal domain-containing protein [Bryobacteraceae bacterium]